MGLKDWVRIIVIFIISDQYLGFLVLQKKTSIWVLDKQRWIQGPKIPDKLWDPKELDCVHALNSTTAVFLRKTGMSYYNFNASKWIHTDTLTNYFLDLVTCEMIQNKLGQKVFYIMERFTGNFFLTSINIDTNQGKHFV